MKNLMERGMDLANILGLITGAIAIFYLGYEIDNKNIIIFGAFALTLFGAIFLFTAFLLIRDLIQHGSKLVPKKLF